MQVATLPRGLVLLGALTFMLLLLAQEARAHGNNYDPDKYANNNNVVTVARAPGANFHSALDEMVRAWNAVRHKAGYDEPRWVKIDRSKWRQAEVVVEQPSSNAGACYAFAYAYTNAQDRMVIPTGCGRRPVEALMHESGHLMGFPAGHHDPWNGASPYGGKPWRAVTVNIGWCGSECVKAGGILDHPGIHDIDTLRHDGN